MEVSPATNFVSETLCPSESVGDGCDHSGRLSAIGESTLPGVYGVCGEEAAQENCNTDTQFRQLNNDSTLLLTSCSPVSAVAPESWVTTQGNWLLDENEGSIGAESFYAIGPSNMVVVVVFFGFIFLMVFSLNFYTDDIVFRLTGSRTFESRQYVFSQCYTAMLYTYSASSAGYSCVYS